MDPSDFSALLGGGRKGGPPASSGGDWSTAFESSSSSSSSSSSRQGFQRDTRHPSDVAHALATSEATFHAFATDGAAVLSLLAAHPGEWDLDELADDLAAGPLPTQQPAGAPGWSVLDPPQTSARARDHWNHWARDFTHFGNGGVDDGAAVVAMARGAAGDGYMSAVWGETSVDAWDRALDQWDAERRAKAATSSAPAEAEASPQVKERAQEAAVGRLRLVLSHLKLPKLNKDDVV
ncbi:hypothetical protein H9P43_003035 [Blastocladiella emersonii ATCC 22665]|nr:hypothetical protein H9P43_003035 [Blastocladiella emersonii ATCC 22665]